MMSDGPEVSLRAGMPIGRVKLRANVLEEREFERPGRDRRLAAAPLVDMDIIPQLASTYTHLNRFITVSIVILRLEKFSNSSR